MSAEEETLSSVWDQHIGAEFGAKSAEQALATITTEPYVNNVPLMIGGVGREEVRDFYADHFVSQFPPDINITSISPTIGQGRVVDELIMHFTHTIVLDWLLPGNSCGASTLSSQSAATSHCSSFSLRYSSWILPGLYLYSRASRKFESYPASPRQTRWISTTCHIRTAW